MTFRVGQASRLSSNSSSARTPFLIQFVLLLIGVVTLSAQDTHDPFAAIGALTLDDNVNLVTPEPPTLPDKVLAQGPHDPGAVFTPADKLDTTQELHDALVKMRERFAPFLETHAPALTTTRQVQELASFDWRIGSSDDLRNFEAALAGEGEWQPVSIPHYGEPLGKTNTFYRTLFTVQPWKASEAVFVRFRGVDYKAHVFVNGTYAGSHEGFFAPFEFDITALVNPGTNTLFVRVENDFTTLGNMNHPDYPDLIGDKIYAASGPGYDDPIAGWHHCPPGMGIWQPVSIEVRPRVHVHDIFVQPLTDENAIEATIEIWNSDVTLRDIEIDYAVYGLNFPDTAVQARPLAPLDPAGGGVNFYRARIPLSDFRWWSPDTPWLYDFQVNVSCPELGTTDHARQQFGMRSFRFDESGRPKGRFLLNGEEIRLRGANTMGAEQQCVMRGDLDQLRDDLLLAKIANMNFLRFTQRPVQTEIYDMADRLGLMVQTDFPLFGHMRPNLFAEGVRQVGEMERLIRSHPSCVLITYINERFSERKSGGKTSRRMNRQQLERFFAAANQAAWALNPDRVIKPVDGDYDPPAPGLPDNHCYTLWYFRNGIDIGLLHKGYWQPVKAGWNYGCGEYGAEGLDQVELMRELCPPAWLPTTDDEEWNPSRIARCQTEAMHRHYFDTPSTLEGWVEASRDHQAWATQIMTEAFRRDNRMVSSAIHLFIDAWPTGWMKAIMDVQRQAKPAYFACREALTPLMANIRTDRWRFFSGETVRCEFWICNDTHRGLSDPNLRWQLEIRGRVVHAQRAPATIEPVRATFQGFTAVPAPEVAERTAGRLRLALFDGDTLIHDTSVGLEFFPAANPSGATVRIIGNTDGPAARLATQLGAKTDPEAPILLIDGFEVYRVQKEEIDQAIRNGARAIFVNLPAGEYVLPGSARPTTVNNANPHFLSRATGHPLVDEFEPFDFRFWFDPVAGYLTPLANGKVQGDDWSPVLLTQGAMAVAERPFGKGQVVVCQAFLAGRITTNPTARLFAERLLEYP